jgi:D-arabinitol 2-dehydrogenase
VAREFARLVIEDHVPASIALIASMSGSVVNHPQPQAPYNFTKAGVIHMARSLASEWAPNKIRVNTLSPGYIATALTREILAKDTALKQLWESKVPMGRMAEPDEFGGPLVYMLSDASSYMTGHDLVVDGGYTVW